MHPIHIDVYSGSEREAQELKIKNAHFEKLIVAKNAPTDEEAQTALVRFLGSNLTDAIINQKLNIKIGTCYVNPNKDGNFSCVSCMIVLYNRDKKHWQEAPDGRNFMQNSYNFYQSSEGDYWEANDLTMMIPYDYKVLKKYELK